MGEIAKNYARIIMSKIERGEIKMRPKWYFILGSIFFACGVFMIVFMGSIFINISLFEIIGKKTYEFFYFGPIGILAFFENVPLLTNLFAIFCIFFGGFMLKQSHFAFERSFLAIISLVFIFSLSFGLLLFKTRFNESVGQKYLQAFYLKRLAARRHNWLIGEITEVQDEFVVVNVDGRPIKVIVTQETFYPHSEAKHAEVGQIIKAVGKSINEHFEAIGICLGSKNQ